MRSLLIISLALVSCATSTPSPSRDAGDAGSSALALDSGVTITQTGPNSFVVASPPKADAGVDAGTLDAGTPDAGGIHMESSSKKVRRPLSK
jgi:hypothetical protein